MLIEQKIEVNGQKVTVTRTVTYADKAANTAPTPPPRDVLTSEGPAMSDEQLKQTLQAKVNAQQPTATPAAANPGGAVRVFILRPGGNIEDLGTGGNLEDTGPGGNLSSGVTLIFGGISVQCCGQHGTPPGSSAAE